MQREPTDPDPASRAARRGRWRRVRRRPAIWCALALGLYLVGVAFGWPREWLGVLLVIPLMITATGLGWRVAWPLLPIGVALAWLRDRVAGTPTTVSALVGLPLLLLLATLAGNDLFVLWHRTARRARDNERRARLLSEAALAMQQAHTAAALYRAMPRLLADILEYTHAEVFVPEEGGLRLVADSGTELPADFRLTTSSVMGRALATAEPQLVPDTGAEPAYLGDPRLPASRSEVAFPLRAERRVVAILNVEHAARDAFGEADLRTLEGFVRIAEEVLARLHALERLERHGAEQALVARLEQRLLQAEGAREATAAALAEVVPALGCDAGMVVVLRNASLYPLALFGPIPAPLRRTLGDGVPFRGRMREVWETHRPAYIEDARGDARLDTLTHAAGTRALAIQPITNAGREMQALLLLANQSGSRRWTDEDRRTLDFVATSLGVVLDRATVNRTLVAMLDVVRGLANAEEPAELYHRAAASAVRLIPGAEAATILVRGDDGFRFEAAVGYDLEALRVLGPFDDRDELAWYHDGVEGYRRGIPRVARGTAVHSLSAAAGGERSTAHAAAARVSEIVANICVPITDGGEAVALLNVDSFSNEGAFGSSARRLVEAFAQQVAVIKRQAEAMRQLRRSVVTDPLTGLGNREGFHRRLELELARASRYGHGLNIVMLDLDNFKQVNDRFGHHAGDEALVRVAHALQQATRSSDAAFRWGGDEFVMLLPEVGAGEAEAAAARYLDAVASVRAEGLQLQASVGIARCPEDGTDRETLMKRADDLMYHTKPAQPRGAGGAPAGGYSPLSREGGPSPDGGGGGTVA